jgi:hypothetical protein
VQHILRADTPFIRPRAARVERRDKFSAQNTSIADYYYDRLFGSSIYDKNIAQLSTKSIG